MPTARKTKSGKYRVTIYDYKDASGKIHQKTFTAGTKKEAERLAAQYKSGSSVTDLTVGEAVRSYIDIKKPVLSPSTHKAYESIYRNHFAASRFGAVKLSSVDTAAAQSFVSLLTVSPKTVRNIYGLLSAAVEMYYPEKILKVTLPAKIRPELHTPTTEEIETLLNSIKTERELYIFVMLCAFGPLRRSEACGLKYEDIDHEKNTVTIRRARVQDSEKKWVYKDCPKNESSYRTISYPKEVIEFIEEREGYILTDTPAALSDRFFRRVKSAGLPHFRVHDLRHYGASILHAIGIPDQYIMDRGGWKTDNVMKRVYRDTLTDEQEKVNARVSDYFSKRLNSSSGNNSDSNSD